MSDELPPPSASQIRRAQEIYEELNEMDQQLKITEMILEFLGSGDFLMIILTVAIGITLVKSVKVIDKKINGSKNEE